MGQTPSVHRLIYWYKNW